MESNKTKCFCTTFYQSGEFCVGMLIFCKYFHIIGLNDISDQ